MKIFAISGLGADKRVFDYLTLDYELVAVEWLKENPQETIIDYAKRLIHAYEMDREDNVAILGVSFGGLVATEISKIINPRITILISSVETKQELRLLYRIAGVLKLNNLVPIKLLNPPKPLAHFVFGTQYKALLNDILDDTDFDFVQWGVRELLNWKNETKLDNLMKIGGTKDRLLYPKGRNNYLVQGGGHLMIVDKSAEVSSIINTEITKLLKK